METYYQVIAERDPLQLDSFLARLPDVNASGDLSQIMHNLELAANIIEVQSNVTPIDATAMLRDLDFLIGSALRANCNPIEELPRLETQLLRLGAIADTVPRGSVYTYAAVNPADERQRSFTGTQEERIFISSVSDGINALAAAMRPLVTVSLHDSESYAASLVTASGHMRHMIDSIIKVRQYVSPAFFTNEMRPYFDPICIGGVNYTGAGGAQMMMLGFDRLLWGKTDDDVTYQQYYAENVQYLLPIQRAQIERYSHINDGTIIDHIEREELAADDAMRLAAASLLRQIRKFRYPHRKVAQDNFAVRSNDAVGSGAYTTDILDLLIDKTDQALRRVEQSNEKK